MRVAIDGPGFLLFFEDMAGRPERGISRFALIRDAWTQFTQHPILGGGIGSFVDMEGTIVHNTTLWFLADFGIPGFAVLLGFLGWFLFAGWFAYGQAPLKYKPIVLALLMGHTVMLGLSMGIGFLSKTLVGSLCPDRILLRYRQEASADARHQEKRVPADHPLQKVRTLVEVFGEMSAGHASAGVLLVNCVTFFTTAHPTYDATYKTS